MQFFQVDVFTQKRFCGNPVAVVCDAQTLSGEQMQQIARWTNLSETTFVLPPTQKTADYRLRIFTPEAELPFAGHPTLGTAHVLLQSNRVRARNHQLIQECGVGLINLRLSDESSSPLISFSLPPAEITELSAPAQRELQAFVDIPLSIEHQPCFIDVGARWVVAQCENAKAVLACSVKFEALAHWSVKQNITGLVIFGAQNAPHHARIEVRAFAPACGVNEDPVCGSGNGCVAVFIQKTQQLARFGTAYIAAQGRKLNRDGFVHIDVQPHHIYVGGYAIECVKGILQI